MIAQLSIDFSVLPPPPKEEEVIYLAALPSVPVYADDDKNYVNAYFTCLTGKKSFKKCWEHLRFVCERFCLDGRQMNRLTRFLLEKNISSSSYYADYAEQVAQLNSRESTPYSNLVFQVYSRKAQLLLQPDQTLYSSVVAGMVRLYREGSFGIPASFKAEFLLSEEIIALNNLVENKVRTFPSTSVEKLLAKLTY